MKRMAQVAPPAGAGPGLPNGLPAPGVAATSQTPGVAPPSAPAPNVIGRGCNKPFNARRVIYLIADPCY